MDIIDSPCDLSDYIYSVNYCVYPNIDIVAIDILLDDINIDNFRDIFINEEKMNAGRLDMNSVSEYEIRKLNEYKVNIEDVMFSCGVLCADYKCINREFGTTINTFWYAFCDADTELYKVYMHLIIPEMILPPIYTNR